MSEAPEHRLGSLVYDTATEIEGVLVAITHWFDRSDEAAILRTGVDRDGRPWALHWIPVSRVQPKGSSL